MDMNNYLMGQYYVFKMQNKILYKIDEKAFSNADIYAVYRDIYPINNESKESEYFGSCYEIQKDFIETVLNKLLEIDEQPEHFNDTEKWIKNIPDYWSFINSLGIRRHSTEDYNVYQTLRYLFLDNNGLKEILENMIKDDKCPGEYKGLLKDFDIKEICL
ncbi:hypothetical protein [uncultured Treponema sp.]|uniref:hypothetical protein n=1 Tax=uncultured Treponema sp. TaxID=162155 RepID=UPI0025936A62|nr:hypothetical protein [uncultured Treponema sp.]